MDVLIEVHRSKDLVPSQAAPASHSHDPGPGPAAKTIEPTLIEPSSSKLLSSLFTFVARDYITGTTLA